MLQMEFTIKGGSRLDWQVAQTDCLFMGMGHIIEVISKITVSTAKENMFTKPTKPVTQDSGNRTTHTVEDLRHILMVVVTKASTNLEKNMGMVSIPQLMVRF